MLDSQMFIQTTLCVEHPAANFTGELELQMVPLQVSNQTTLVLKLLLTIRIFTLKPGHVHMLSFCVTFQGIFAEHLSVAYLANEGFIWGVLVG